MALTPPQRPSSGRKRTVCFRVAGARRGPSAGEGPDVCLRPVKILFGCRRRRYAATMQGATLGSLAGDKHDAWFF